MIKEEFRDIPGFEGYQISNLGRVKSFKCAKEKILNNSINSNGYYRVGLTKDRKSITKKVHQLVAITFLSHIPNGTQEIIVDHKNNNPLDNRVENLQLITQRENASKDKKNGTSKYTGVTWAKVSNKWASRIKINGKSIHLGYFNTELEAAKYYQNALKSIENNEEIIISKHIFSSNYKGVSWKDKSKKWTASIKINGAIKHLGYFYTESEASEYYQNALKAIENNEEIVVKKPLRTSTYKGVSFIKSRNKWRAQITINSKSTHLGRFNTEIEAHNAYQNKLSEINNKLN